MTCSVFYESHDLRLLLGSAWDVAASLDDDSVDCVVTSPPYWRLRDYGGRPEQWGQERSVGQYVDRIVGLFGLLLRKMKPEGVVWLNLGDKRVDGQLCGVPWMVAKDLQTDGWHLRSAVVWQKPNGMPESCTDRVSQNYEHVFMLTRGRDHYFDLDPLRVMYDGDRSASRRARSGHTNKGNSATGVWSGEHSGRNPGSVWSIPTQPFPGAHEAVMPLELARRCVVSSCPEGGLVFDPFHGSGTTAQAAVENGRRYVGGDINEGYLRLSLDTRLQNGTLDLGGALS